MRHRHRHCAAGSKRRASPARLRTRPYPYPHPRRGLCLRKRHIAANRDCMTPAIFGLAGLTLSDDERAFFRDADPAGYILFGRNIASRAQLRALTDELRAIHGRDKTFICIDQEGGPVARMKPPEWLAYPPGAVFDALYDVAPISAIEAARTNARALGQDLAEAGVSVDCLPLLDV